MTVAVVQVSDVEVVLETVDVGFDGDCFPDGSGVGNLSFPIVIMGHSGNGGGTGGG